MNLELYKKNRKQRKKHHSKLIFIRDSKNRIDKERIICSKYSSRKYENHRKWHKRNRNYIRTFNLGKKTWVQFGVWISSSHNRFESRFVCGKNVSLCRNVELDYTGDLEIGDGVGISEGAKILTHGHDFLGTVDEAEILPNTNRAYPTKLVIEDNVLIGTRAIIMPGVKVIGKNSMVAAGSVVTKTVLPNTIVAGVPAKQIKEFTPEDRLNTKIW